MKEKVDICSIIFFARQEPTFKKIPALYIRKRFFSPSGKSPQLKLRGMQPKI